MTRSVIAPTILIAALCLLAACGKADNDPGPGNVTIGEARALDEAAEMIEAQRLPSEAISPPAATATGQKQTAPAPSPVVSGK